GRVGLGQAELASAREQIRQLGQRGLLGIEAGPRSVDVAAVLLERAQSPVRTEHLRGASRVVGDATDPQAARRPLMRLTHAPQVVLDGREGGSVVAVVRDSPGRLRTPWLVSVVSHA